jgi:hypothetical protein
VGHLVPRVDDDREDLGRCGQARESGARRPGCP